MQQAAERWEADSAVEASLGAPAQDSPPQVVYIMGEGRSGSTLLARLLGALPGFVNVGELRYLWRRGMIERHPCGCGVPLPECPFWTDVIHRAFPGFGPEQLERLAQVQEAVDRPDKFLLTGRFRLFHGREYEALRAEYQENLRRLFAAIRDVSGGCVIVDSSKTPVYGEFLTRTQGIRLSLIHLVRDCRAVGHSKARKKRWVTGDDSEVRYMYGNPYKNTIRWNITNYLCGRLRSATPDSVRMRYEDLVADPNGALREALEKIGLADRAGGIAFVNGETELGLSCTVSGNPDRFKSGPLNIRLDDEWRSKMPGRQRLLLTVCGLPCLLRYGYLK